MSGAEFTRRQTVLAGIGLAAAACAPRGGLGSTITSNFDWSLVRPEDVGVSSTGLKRAGALLQRYVDDRKLTGAVSAIVRHNKLIWYEAQGVRDVASGAPMRKDDIFRMASSSKPVTAVAILILMEAGRLSLSDKVSRFLPGFANPKVAVAPEGWLTAMGDPTARAEMAKQLKLVPAEREITIEDLLTHTAGLSTFGPSVLAEPFDHRPDDTLATYIDRLSAKPLDFQPGTKFAYSPVDGFDVLMRIVEVASGVPGDVFVSERILRPLEMDDTYYNVPHDKAHRQLTLYERKNDRWVEAPSAISSKPMRYISGAGTLRSTVRDYIQFYVALLKGGSINGRRILRPETVALMASNQIGDLYQKAGDQLHAPVAGQGFGLGLNVVLDAAAASLGRGTGAFGWPGAYGTTPYADPSLDLVCALFIQQAEWEIPLEFQRAVREAILDA